MIHFNRAASAVRCARSVAVAAALLLLAPGAALGVILDGMNQCTVKLSDGTDVVLYGEFISKMSPGARSVAADADLETQRIAEIQARGLPALERYRYNGYVTTADVRSRAYLKADRDRENVGKTDGEATRDLSGRQVIICIFVKFRAVLLLASAAPLRNDRLVAFRGVLADQVFLSAISGQVLFRPRGETTRETGP